MRRPAKRRRRVGWYGVWLLPVVMLGGCGSPPSVVPLLAVTERALEAEAQRLVADGERDSAWVNQTRAALEEAYRADLAEAAELTPAWVREATQVYVMAREALVRHEQALQQERRQRADNLQAAAEATRRAAAILQGQDELITRMVGTTAWGLLVDEPRASD